MLAALGLGLAQTGFAADRYCSDLIAVSATSGWSTVQMDQSIGSKPITLGGKVYAKGLGTHAPSEIVYTLASKYATFSADVGLDDETTGKGSVEFKVFADDSLLFSSGVMVGNVAAKKIVINVSGKNKLKLVTTIGPDTYDWDDADWAGARLTEMAATDLRPRILHRGTKSSTALLPLVFRNPNTASYVNLTGRAFSGTLILSK